MVAPQNHSPQKSQLPGFCGSRAPSQVRISVAAQQNQAQEAAAAQTLGKALATITTQAAKPGQDGPISPPVLAEAFQ